eukprot:TRINITY_DN2830_c0_g1_i1.p1 TRINITY_DN2830_c0_g1~~TRINITY_DN2830_c0_g1_i1.p1  ORF type:complete len:511 (+),score=127.27 TRINITY_DN2830_c0_g1_i1:443-1975(+)
MLLSACKVDDPTDASTCTINERDIENAEQSDFKMFTSLAYLDLGDNRLPLDLLCAFPALQELHLYCNMISEIQPLSGFPQLQYLDLSFNFINPDHIVRLAEMPRLKVLDLTGNNISFIPAGMEAFYRLERLILEDNRLSDPASLLNLQTIPKLRELDLSDNQYSIFPEIDDKGFPSLEFINFSSNQIKEEDDITTLAMLPNLQEVLLWNNPLVVKSRGQKPTLNKLRQALVDELGIYVMIEPPPTMKTAPVIFDPSTMTKVVDEFAQMKTAPRGDQSWEISQYKRTAPTTTYSGVAQSGNARTGNRDGAGDFFLTQDPNQDADDDAMLREEERLFQAHLAAFQEREAELDAYGFGTNALVGQSQTTQKTSADDTHAAYAALRLALANPVVHPVADMGQGYLQPTNAASQKTKPRIKKQKSATKTKTSRVEVEDKKETVGVAHVEQVLDTMKKRLEVVEQNLAAVLHNENVLKEFPQSIRLLERAQREFDKLKSTTVPMPQESNPRAKDDR